MRAQALLDLLAPKSVREAAEPIKQVVKFLTTEDGPQRPPQDYAAIYKTLGPLRDTFMKACRAENDIWS